MTDTDLAFSSIKEIARLFRKRKLSPVELTKLLLARIEKLNPQLNAYITVTADQALAQAKKAQSELFAPHRRKGHQDRGPLHGIPISLKDNIYTKDIRTTAGSKILKDFIPQQDALVVSQLKKKTHHTTTPPPTRDTKTPKTTPPPDHPCPNPTPKNAPPPTTKKKTK